MSHEANDTVMDKIRDMEDELALLQSELASLDSENELLTAADVYNEIIRINKEIETLLSYL